MYEKVTQTEGEAEAVPGQSKGVENGGRQGGEEDEDEDEDEVEEGAREAISLSKTSLSPLNVQASSPGGGCGSEPEPASPAVTMGVGRQSREGSAAARPTMMTDAEAEAIVSSDDFLSFFTRSSRVMERLLGQRGVTGPADFLKDYARDAHHGQSLAFTFDELTD
jgi:hypothetical protein